MPKTPKDMEFYENMLKSPPIGQCTKYVERKWKKWKSQMRKAKRKERVQEENANQQTATEEEVEAAVGEDETMQNQIRDHYGYVPEDDEPPNKKQYTCSDVLDHPDDDMAHRYRHIWSGPRSVKPEYYIVKSILQYQYHQMNNQILPSRLLPIICLVNGRSMYQTRKRGTTPCRGDLK